MKSNKEFLEGVYNKAKILEEKRNRKNVLYKSYIKFSSIAAIIVILPLLILNSKDSGLDNYKEIPQMTRMLIVNDPQSNFLGADYIVIGETEKVYESKYVEENYIYTDISIRIDNILLGDIDKDEIILRVKGGKVKKEKVFSPMEGEFTRGSKSLLFLYKDENDVYYLVNGSESQFKEIENDLFEDKSGNKYDLNKIKENIDRR